MTTKRWSARKHYDTCETCLYVHIEPGSKCFCATDQLTRNCKSCGMALETETGELCLSCDYHKHVR